MMKKFWILILSLSILFVVPANAVQIEAEEDSFLNSGNEMKTFEINDILLNNNETADINGTINNETTYLNGTVGNCTNGTFVNETTDLNSTVGNCTNGTFINGTFVNGTDVNSTVGNDTNGTVDEEKLKEQKQKLKENIISTLNNVAAISAVCTGVLMTISSILVTVPEPTLITKVITVGCVVGTAVGCAVSIGCAIGALFLQWWM